MLTESIHLDIQTLLKTTSLTLVSTLLVHDTVPIALAGIDHVSPYTPHEKPATAITGVHAIMPPRRDISTNFA